MCTAADGTVIYLGEVTYRGDYVHLEMDLEAVSSVGRGGRVPAVFRMAVSCDPAQRRGGAAVLPRITSSNGSWL